VAWHGCQNVDPAFSWTIRLQVHHARAYTPPSDVYGTRSWAEWVSTKCAFPYSSAGTSASLIARTRVDIAGGVRTALLWLRRIDGATGRDRRTRSEEVIRVVVGVSGVPAAAGGLAFNALVQADVGKRCSLEPACRL